MEHEKRSAASLRNMMRREVELVVVEKPVSNLRAAILGLCFHLVTSEIQNLVRISHGSFLGIGSTSPPPNIPE